MFRYIASRRTLLSLLVTSVLLADLAEGADLRGGCIKHGSDKTKCCADDGCAFPSTGGCLSKKSNRGTDACRQAEGLRDGPDSDVTRCAAHSGKEHREDCCKTKGCGAANPGCLTIQTFERDKKLTNLQL